LIQINPRWKSSQLPHDSCPAQRRSQLDRLYQLVIDDLDTLIREVGLVAFAVAAILLAYRARLKHRAEIIASASEKERLEAIATTAEFFRVDVSGLTRAQQQDIALTQIHARARRDLLLAGVSLVVAILLAGIAMAAIWASRPAGPATIVVPSGPVFAPGHDFHGTVNIGLNEK
jgi:hypothetical protein